VIKDFIISLPQIFGIVLHMAGDKLTGISYWLHIKFQTKTGKMLQKMENSFKGMEQDIRQVVKSNLSSVKEQAQENSIFKQEKKGEIVPLKGKKNDPKSKI